MRPISRSRAEPLKLIKMAEKRIGNIGFYNLNDLQNKIKKKNFFSFIILSSNVR